ncbi:cytochrome P450 [Xylaria arbuscula]|nr:cytochrome P450 [Xylaria arbuscula]
MSFPLRRITAASIACSYILVAHQSHWWRLHYVGTFFSAWVLQLVAWVVWVVLLYPHYFSSLRHLPEPQGGSWWNGHFTRIRKEPSGVPMRDWAATIPNDGIMRYKGFLNQERLLVLSPKALSEVLVTKCYDFEKPAALSFNLARVLGVGVLLAEGEEHKVQRKNLMPAFSFRHVKDLYPLFWEKTREVVVAMTEHINAELATNQSASAVIEVGEWASRVTLDIIGVAGLGRDFGAIQNHNSELVQVYRRIMSPTPQAQRLGLLSLIFGQWLVSLIPVSANDDINAAADFIRQVCRSLIIDKKEKLVRKKAGGEEPVEHDILSIALESGGFSDEELVDQLMTFLAAGHETTASGMTWAIYELAKRPEIQEKLRAEIRERLPSVDSDASITSLGIDHMPYLNAVCNEVLRFYAPVPMMLRDAARDTTVVGHVIPKGTRIMLSPWATNFDKELWGPDANEFVPERWLTTTPTVNGGGLDDKHTASGGAASNFALLTFSHGPRSCIGSNFAKGEFLCLLAGWVGRFAFKLKNKEEADMSKVDIQTEVTARPRKGMYVHATPINGW